MNKILEILHSLHPEVTFEGKTDLVDSGLLDSFDIVTLIGELSDVFKVEVGVENLEPENFNSPEAIYELLKSLGASL